jgi:hypothetical protein
MHQNVTGAKPASRSAEKLANCHPTTITFGPSAPSLEGLTASRPSGARSYAPSER